VSGGLEVTKGSPDDEELAAVVIAVEVIAARAVASEPEPVSRWRTSLRDQRENARPRSW
jgi:hypothetical protein